MDNDFFDLLYEPLGFNVNNLAAVNDITGAPIALGIHSSDILTNLLVGTPPGNIATPLTANYSSMGYSVGEYYKGDDFGIVIGTGNTAVTPTDDALVTKILHGETAGTLLHGGTEVYGLTFANPNVSLNIRRYFTNVLGGAIAVTEAGLYSPGLRSFYNSHLYCICRDVFAAVTVNNGEILSVVYTVQTVV